MKANVHVQGAIGERNECKVTKCTVKTGITTYRKNDMLTSHTTRLDITRCQ